MAEKKIVPPRKNILAWDFDSTIRVLLASLMQLCAGTMQSSGHLLRNAEWHSRISNEAADDADDDGTRLGLRTAGLVMEGFRRVDEWRLIEDSFDFGDVLFRDDLAIDNLSEQEELRAEERSALEAIDGDATVGEILDQLGGSSFESCKVLYRLLNGRLVKRRTS